MLGRAVCREGRRSASRDVVFMAARYSEALCVLILCILSSVRDLRAEIVTWIAPGDGLWDEPSHWSTGVLPGPADQVVVDITEPPTIIHASGDTRILSLTLSGNLQLDGGSITVNSTSTITGTLAISPGAALVAEGAAAALTLSGEVQLNGGSLIARDDALIALPGTTHQAGAGLIRAEGPGSRILMDAVAQIGIPPADIPELTEGISREASFYRGQLDSSDILEDLTEAVSRQASFFRGRLDSAHPLNDLTEAVSREASFYRGRLDSADPLDDLTEAVSREVCIRRGAPEPPL
jgi:hypothetical protein